MGSCAARCAPYFTRAVPVARTLPPHERQRVGAALWSIVLRFLVGKLRFALSTRAASGLAVPQPLQEHAAQAPHRKQRRGRPHSELQAELPCEAGDQPSCQHSRQAFDSFAEAAHLLLKTFHFGGKILDSKLYLCHIRVRGRPHLRRSDRQWIMRNVL